eukprot:COSAG01_NODE_4971_length_4580_cov_12.996206_2_plen_112_part_00
MCVPRVRTLKETANTPLTLFERFAAPQWRENLLLDEAVMVHVLTQQLSHQRTISLDGEVTSGWASKRVGGGETLAAEAVNTLRLQCVTVEHHDTAPLPTGFTARLQEIGAM